MRLVFLFCLVACEQPKRVEAPRIEAVAPAPLAKAEVAPASAAATPADDHSVTYYKYTDAHGVTAIVDDLKSVPVELRANAIKVQMPVGDTPAAAPAAQNPALVDQANVWRALNPTAPPSEAPPEAAPSDASMTDVLQKAKDNVEKWQAKQNEEQREIDKVLKSIK